MRFLAILLLLCTLSACSLAPNEYLSVSPYAGSTVQMDQTDAVIVADYAQLKAAILELVRAGQTEGSIRAANYAGDLERDLAEAAYEVAKTEPLGAYAVDYMTHDCTLIVNYYEIDIRITFRRTPREIASIEPLISQNLLQSRLKRAVDDLEERVTVELRNYRDTDIASIVTDYCAENPGTVMEIPTVSVSVYPDSGTTRIVEIDLQYTESPALLREKRQAVQESVSAAAEYIRYRQTDQEKTELLFTYMTERFTYQDTPTVTPVHDALCAGVATPEGLASAFQLVCDRAGVECYTVNGLRSGQPYTWNIVSFDGEYRHTDLAADILGGTFLRFRTDPEMTDYYWSQIDYPACISVLDPVPEEQPPAEDPPTEEAPPSEDIPSETEPPEAEPAPPADEAPAPPQEEPPAQAEEATP